MAKSIKKLNKKKREISEIEKERKRILKIFFRDCELVEGSFQTVLIRCGRPGCHCRNKPIHQATRLSWWENGKLKNKIVRVDDRKWVKKLSDNYREHKEALSNLVKMNEKEKKIFQSIVKCKAKKYV